jgi:hypothetical protein
MWIIIPLIASATTVLFYPNKDVCDYFANQQAQITQKPAYCIIKEA